MFNKKTILIICVFSFFALICVIKLLSKQQTARPSAKLEIPTPPKEHPRLFLYSSSLPALKNKWNVSYEEPVIDFLKNKIIGDLESSYLYNKIKAHAFHYLLFNSNDSATQAITGAISGLMNLKESDHQREIGRLIEAAAYTYDWCYPRLSNSDKETIIREIDRVSKFFEGSKDWPETSQGSVTSHFVEIPVPTMLSAGIACYDEHPEFYNDATNWLYGEFVPVSNFFFQGGMHHQGSAYGIAPRFSYLVKAMMAIVGMGAANPFSDDIQKIAYRPIYQHRPDGKFMPEGDDFRIRKIGYGTAYHVAFLANYYQDPYIQLEYTRYHRGQSEHISDYVLDFIFYDPELEPLSLDTLPLTRYFDYPFGKMIARTGWDMGNGSPTVIAQFGIKAFQYNNHDHLDAGHFSVYYKGSLAIDSGAYAKDITGKQYGGDHHMKYFQRTIAHNSLLIFDPDEPAQKGISNGGQAWPNNGSEYRRIPDAQSQVLEEGPFGDILAHEFGPDPQAPDYSYLKGDLTKAYTKLADKVSEVKRSFVFLNLKNTNYPAVFIVYDKVTSTDSGFKKTWLIHSIEEPVIQDNRIIIKRTEGYSSGGRLINDTLIPENDNRIFTVIGGPGKEFLSGNKNHPLETTEAVDEYEAGRWRVELSPVNSVKTDRFLNVMHVTDNEAPAPLKAYKVETAEVVGVIFHDHVVIFSQNGELLNRSFSFTMHSSKDNLKYLITDLENGDWTVPGVGTYTADKDGGVIYFQASPGTYKIKPAGSLSKS